MSTVVPLLQWVHHQAEERPVAWVALDESDNDAVRFWTHVLTALEATGVGTQALVQLSAPGIDAPTIALSALLNELAERSDTRVLVPDDFHVVTARWWHDSRRHRDLLVQASCWSA